MVNVEVKREYRRWPGLIAAAADLGVSYGHLRMVVATGERTSPKLLSRFQRWQDNHPGAIQSAKSHVGVPSSKAAGKPTPRHISFAAAQNLGAEFFQVLARLGFDVVIIRLEAQFASPIWGFPELVNALDAELQSSRAGNYDSSHFGQGVIYHFFHVAELAQAVRILKAGLESRGLLNVAMILHAESDEKLRVWHPSTAEEIAV